MWRFVASEKVDTVYQTMGLVQLMGTSSFSKMDNHMMKTEINNINRKKKLGLA